MNTPKVASARLWCCLVLTFLAITLAAGSANAAPLPGAVFTTGPGCTGVDLNIYTSMTDVWLDGGPDKTGSSLPAGSYYVQVTEPNGTVLGSSVGTANPTPYVVTLDGSGNAVVPCFELYNAVYTKSSNFTTLGFDPTTNPGGEYKVWVSTDPRFANDSTKTDNFKVLSSPTPPPSGSISGLKFYDANANGARHTGESVIDGWQVRLFTLDPRLGGRNLPQSRLDAGIEPACK